MADQRPEDRMPPRFSGVMTHRDRLGRYSIRYPTDWGFYVHEDSGEGGQDGITFQPISDDARTFFNIWIRELEQGIVAEDLENLREGVQEGLKQLPAVGIEDFSEVVLDNLIKFEFVYRFREADKAQDVERTLKRKTWVLYVDRWQYMLTWQGSSPAEYEYWLAMANYSYGSFDLPPSLWFATDRDLLSRYAKELGREEPVEGKSASEGAASRDAATEALDLAGPKSP